MTKMKRLPLTCPRRVAAGTGADKMLSLLGWKARQTAETTARLIQSGRVASAGRKPSRQIDAVGYLYLYLLFAKNMAASATLPRWHFMSVDGPPLWKSCRASRCLCNC